MPEGFSLGEEICRRRSSLMVFPLTAILGMLLLLIGLGALASNQLPFAFPAAYRPATVLICLPLGAGLVVLALWLRPWICYHERGLEVRPRFGPPRPLAYEQVETLILFRSQGKSHGIYTGTVLQMFIKPFKGLPVKLVQSSNSHKEHSKGLLDSPRERVEQPEDRVAAAIATYIAPRFMKRIDQGEEVKFGTSCSISKEGIRTRHRRVWTLTPWEHVCGPMRADDDSLHAVRTDGRTLPLLSVATIPNLLVLSLLVEVLARGEPEAAAAPQ
jgi:hypothetical protein